MVRKYFLSGTKLGSSSSGLVGMAMSCGSSSCDDCGSGGGGGGGGDGGGDSGSWGDGPETAEETFDITSVHPDACRIRIVS